MISYKHKCIFVHIPKTGGTTVESLIWRPKDKIETNLWMGFIDNYNNKYQTGGLQHLLSHQIKQEVGDKVFNSFFKFCFVRNPYDKAVSQYEYLNKRKDLRDYLGFKIGDSFDKYLELIQFKNHVQWEPQTNFIYTNEEKCLVNHVAKFESFNKEIKFILDKINLSKSFFGLIDRKIPHLNKSSRSNYKNYYNSHSKKTLEKIYFKDLELLNYSF